MYRQTLLALVATAAAVLVATPASAQVNAYKVAPSQLSDYWVRTTMHVDVSVPNGGQGLKAVGCASVSYLIGANGNTYNVKVEKVYPKTSDFSLMAKTFVQGLHYAPTDSNTHDMPVATYFIVPFNVPTGDKAALEHVLKQCHLPGYGD
ncbi:MAG TPA: energy transducer TonB [Rhodanobacteraceae bacterium]